MNWFQSTATFSGGLGDSSPNVTQPPYSAISHSTPLNPELLLLAKTINQVRDFLLAHQRATTAR